MQCAAQAARMRKEFLPSDVTWPLDGEQQSCPLDANFDSVAAERAHVEKVRLFWLGTRDINRER